MNTNTTLLLFVFIRGPNLLLFCLCLTAERDVGLPREFPIISEVDGVPRTEERAALATQRLGVHRQEILFRIPQANVGVLAGGLHMIEREILRHALGFALDAQHASCR